MSARDERAQQVDDGPAFRRLQRPTWRDRRLIVGLVLVLASTLLGARLLGAESAGAPVWAARADLPAGLTLRASDLVRREVVLAESAAAYVSAAAPVPDGTVLARAVGAGELLAATAVAPAAAAGDQRTVTVPVERFHAATDLARGEQVDVYVTSSAERGEVAAPELLAASAKVVDIEDAGGRFGGAGAARGIALSVPAAEVTVLVGGLSRGTISLVRVARPERSGQ